MKNNFFVFSATVFGIALLTACSGPTVYWNPVDHGLSHLSVAAAQRKLNRDVAACTRLIDGGSFRSAPAARVRRAASYQGFEGCMNAHGWVREVAARAHAPARRQATAVTAAAPAPVQNDHAAPPADETGRAIVMRPMAEDGVPVKHRNALVPAGASKTFGLQTFYDSYTEPSLDVHVKTQYYGVTGSYTYRTQHHLFVMLQGRVARGGADYSSPDGTIHGIPDYEGDVRVMMGQDYRIGRDNWISPYWGVGARIFRDNGKGYVTTLGSHGYDRRIRQLYMPIGATWSKLFFDHVPVYTTLEADPLLLGNVNSRLQNDGYANMVNTQSFLTGIGVRGSIMFGVPVGKKDELQLGPFVRYWHITQSTTKIVYGCCAGDEPTNNRLQVGMTARVRF